MKLHSAPAAVEFPGHGLFIIKSHHADGFSMKEEAWPFHKLCWIAAGKGSINRGGRIQPLQPGDVLAIPQDLPHRFVDAPSSPMTLLIVCFRDHVVAETEAARDLFDAFMKLQSPIQVFHLAQHVQGRIRKDMRTLLLEQQMQRAGWAAATTSLFTSLLVYLTRAIPLRDQNNPDDHFNLSVAHIEENFFEKLGVADLAAMCNVSVRTYSGLFKKRLGMTVTDFILQHRIDFAKERLRDSGNITFTAMDSGFSDLAHFYRTFKKQVGMTPGQYRAKQVTRK